MGAWGPGFWSDDYTYDVRNRYLDLLRRGSAPEEAVTKLLSEFCPEEDEESGYLFWLTIASLQWDYGYLGEALQAKTLAILDSGVDEERWAESARPADQRKRREVMEKLRQKLASVQEKPKKLRPYGYKRTRWKVGDIISLRFGLMADPTIKPPPDKKYWPYHNCYGAALVVDFWEEDLGDIYVHPVIACYDWIGASEATEGLLQNVGFIEINAHWLSDVDHLLWCIEVPWKLIISWHDLKKIGHVDEIPSALLKERGSYVKKCIPVSILEDEIVDHWIAEGKTSPKV